MEAAQSLDRPKARSDDGMKEFQYWPSLVYGSGRPNESETHRPNANELVRVLASRQQAAIAIAATTAAASAEAICASG